MPTYRSITMGLVSQFDILTIPEYAPPLHPNDPFSPSPTLINDDKSLVSVYIPTYPSSQFWLSYLISPPYPPNVLYYFKLFHNGVCVVSWGCGEEDGYRGKTMFGLFDSEQSWFGESGVEKRAFCFARESGGARKMRSNNLGDVMEVRVYRSRGRRRAEPELTQFNQSALSKDAGIKAQHENNGGSINFANAGLVSYRHPHRYYNYALLDPLDQPFATFRWYYRTWVELESIGVISPEPSIATASLHTTENKSTPASKEDKKDSGESSDALTSYDANKTAPSFQTAAGDTASNTADHFSPPSPPASPPLQPTKLSPFQKPTSLADRSPTPIPSSNKHSTGKRGPTPNPNPIDNPHASRFTEWLRRTPSPVKREIETQRTDSTLSGRPRGNSMGMLKGVVAAAVKRRGAGRSEEEVDGD